MTQNGPSEHYTYDAEDRLITADGYTYYYDGDGERVLKLNSSGDGILYSNGVSGTAVQEDTPDSEWVYLFFNGHRVARVDDTGTPNYYMSDHLGSLGVVTDESGTIEQESDYYPYGGEMVITAGSGSGADNYQFTGKERDNESGLDNFGARYNTSNLGRFMTPDQPVDQHPADPQSWNLYSYVRNNPLVLTDPSGNYVCGTSMSTAQCDQFQKILDKAENAAKKMKQEYGADSKQYKGLQHALDAYGKEGIDNGVTVNLSNATAGYPGMTTASDGAATTSLNPTGQDIQVTINSGLFNSGDTNAIAAVEAHEGSHVADAEDWAKAGFTDAGSPTNLETEDRAYGVMTSVMEAFGATTLSASHNGKVFPDFWMKNATAVYNERIGRPSMIKMFYPNWAEKAFQKNTKEGGK